MLAEHKGHRTKIPDGIRRMFENTARNRHSWESQCRLPYLDGLRWMCGHAFVIAI